MTSPKKEENENSTSNTFDESSLFSKEKEAEKEEITENKSPKFDRTMLTELSDADFKEKVITAIKTVFDPEIPVDVYELGLIYDVKIYPMGNIYILMTLTSPSCPSAEEIPGEIEMKVKAMQEVNEVQVELTFDPPYTQDMMSEAAQLELGFL